VSLTKLEEECKGDFQASMLSLGPSPRLLHRSPDVGSSLGRAGIEREVVVFKGTFNPVLGHAIAISGYTKGYVCSGGPVLVLAGSPEAFERQITSVPVGEKETPVTQCTGNDSTSEVLPDRKGPTIKNTM